MECEICEHYEKKNYQARKDSLVILGIIATLFLGICLGWVCHQIYADQLAQYNTALQILKTAVMK